MNILNNEDFEKYDLIIFGNFYYTITNNIINKNLNQEFLEFQNFLLSDKEYLNVFKLAVQNYFLSEIENYIFYAIILESFNDKIIISKYLLSKFFFQSKQYVKAIQILEKNKLIYINDNFKILYCKCLYNSEKYEECKMSLEIYSNIQLNSFESELENLKANTLNKIKPLIDEQKNTYKLSLRSNFLNYKSFYEMNSFYILNKTEMVSFLNELKERHDNHWIIILYLINYQNENIDFENKLNNLISEKNCNLNFKNIDLENNFIYENPLLNLLFINKCSILISFEANKRLFEYKFTEAEFLAKLVYFKDKYNEIINFILINIYKINEDVNKIMKLSLDLLKNLPENYISFYCAGIFYDLNDKIQKSRNHFEKSIKLNSNFIHGYLELANSYSKKCETDNALHVYLNCLNKFPLCYLSHGFLGIEYGKNNDLNYSILKLKKSLEINQNEPFFLNELGYILYKQGNYKEALDYLLLAEKNCINSEFLIKDIFNNLSHCFRKLERFDESHYFIDKTLKLENSSKNNFTKAFLSHITDNYKGSGDFYYKAIS